VVLMAADPLDEVLRLVAEGRLTADEAAPILAALDERGGAAPRPDPTAGSGGAAGPAGLSAAGRPTADDLQPGRATSLRLEIRDGGRQVVNLRLPIAIGRLAIDKVPGLSGDQVERVREALASGIRGPILSVDDGDGDTVRIVVE
jgi:hypothetical protein